MMSETDQVKALRLLRSARASEPATMTKDRRRVMMLLVQRGLLEPVGERRAAVLLKLTKRGEDELRVLEQTAGEKLGVDYAVKAAVRRATER